MTELDREIQAAVEALTHRLANRDPEVDDEPFAMEFIQAILGRGWRPTEARRPPAWSPSTEGDSPLPQPDKPGGTAYLEARRAVEQLAERAAAQRNRGDAA